MQRSRQLAAALCALLLASCPGQETNRVRLYHSEPRAPSLSEEAIKSLEHMGPTTIDQGINFAVYSEHATRIELAIFEDPEASRPTKQFPMTRFGDVWNVYVEGVGVGTYYGYIAWGPNWPYDPTFTPGTVAGFVADVDDQGNRFNPNKLLIDPYAKAIHRDHDWSKGSVASGPARAQSTYAAASKSVVVDGAYQWSDNEATWRGNRQKADFPGHNWQDLIFYEVHVKGFTKDVAASAVLSDILGKSAKVEHPGTYRGVGEMADYLKDLGITAVELMPVHEKPLDGGYWGYMSLSFFAPEFSYSTTAYTQKPDARTIIPEFKWMVDQLHQRGIEVVCDVVYNHYGEGGLWRQKRELGGGTLDGDTVDKMVNVDPDEVAGLYTYRGLDNAAYYALSADNKGYWNNTGVGQDSRANHRPVRKLIMDSLRFYAEELHVDGFRFDLAPELGEKDGDYNNWDDVKNTVLQEIIDDPVLQKYNTRIIAEPWAAGGNDPYKVSKFPNSTNKDGTAWSEWNGRFRDWWRAFQNNDGWVLNSQEGDADGGFLLTGSDRYFKWNGRRPYNAVNFVTVHDGFTMYDIFTYASKQNGCSPLNPSCCDSDRLSAWCDKNSGEDNNRSRDWGGDAAGEQMKRQLMRNLFTAMMISHGSPLILGGDEWMRTQLGNNNAYSTRADNEANWFQWGIWKTSAERQRMHDFVRKIVAFRKSHGYALEPAQYGEGAPFSWKNEFNGDGPNWSSKHLMIHYWDKSKGPELAILINGERSYQNFKLPDLTGGRSWHVVVDTQGAYDNADYLQQKNKPFAASANVDLDGNTVITDGQYGAQGSTMVILEAK